MIMKRSLIESDKFIKCGTLSTKVIDNPDRFELKVI